MAMYRETLEVQKWVLGQEHPSTLNTTMCLASVLDMRGRYAKAVAMHLAIALDGLGQRLFERLCSARLLVVVAGVVSVWRLVDVCAAQPMYNH